MFAMKFCLASAVLRAQASYDVEKFWIGRQLRNTGKSERCDQDFDVKQCTKDSDCQVPVKNENGACKENGTCHACGKNDVECMCPQEDHGSCSCYWSNEWGSSETRKFLQHTSVQRKAKMEQRTMKGHGLLSMGRKQQERRNKDRKARASRATPKKSKHQSRHLESNSTV